MLFIELFKCITTILTSKIPYFENDYGFLNQIFIPLIGGALGCWIRFLIAFMSEQHDLEDSEKNSTLKKYTWAFLLIGAIAGIVAVNLLNPKGSFAQVLTISVLAGLSGMTYLFRSSFVDSVIEDNIVKGVKNATLRKHEKLKSDLNSGLELSPEQLAEMIGSAYNIPIDDIDQDDEDAVEENPSDESHQEESEDDSSAGESDPPTSEKDTR